MLGLSQGIKKLQPVSYLQIYQKPNWLECSMPCCFEIPNEYALFESDSDFKTPGKEIGKIEENSGFLCRYFCRAYRQFSTQLNIDDYAVGRSERPYRCPFFCFWRPELTVFKGHEHIGTIQAPYLLCSCCLGNCLKLEILDGQGNYLYEINEYCLQGGIFLPCVLLILCRCMNSCERIQHKIIDMGKEQVGSIQNIFYGCNKIGLLSCRSDKYGIKFLDNANLDQKILIIYAAIFLDYLQYLA